MAARDLVLAQLTGARCHVAHISTRNAGAMVDYARRQALPVTCETTPPHFALTDVQIPYDSNYRMKPPLRSGRHRDPITDGLAAGRITLARLVELFTTGRESVLRQGRGTLAPGAPGDVTVFSTDVEWTYDVNQSASRSRNSPFHGRTFHGGAMATVVDGELKWRR